MKPEIIVMLTHNDVTVEDASTSVTIVDKLTLDPAMEKPRCSGSCGSCSKKKR